MQHLRYLEIENFKRFGSPLRIELGHPAVLIGPNNCGKTSAIQALALWGQAVKTWYDVRKDSSARERTATALNRLAIVSVPVQRTRYFWHNTQVRTGNKDVSLVITVGVQWNDEVHALPMRFRNQGEDLVYCTPDQSVIQNLDLIAHAASLNIELLYPMSGLDSEEAIVQPGRIDVLLGQGQTAQVLRNLCLMVLKQSSDDWARITQLMKRLFNVQLSLPQENARGSINLSYQQIGVKDALDISSSGRGFQQMLLIFAYLYSHKRSVLLVDEPDAHLEILRQKQIYVLLRDIAEENDSQVVLVTHSEVILDEALDTNLTLLLDGQTDDLASKKDIRNSLKHFGADNYVKARERGYVFYVEGGTDVDMLRALADRLGHPAAGIWDERINSFYVQDNYPDKSADSELERVEGGFGITPKDHFNGLRNLIPSLRGLAILDNDGRAGRQEINDGALRITYWNRYEAENYFITPEVLRDYAIATLNRRRSPAATVADTSSADLFDGVERDIDEVLDLLVKERIFDGNEQNFQTWKNSPPDAARLVWETSTRHKKLSSFAEEFFRRLAERVGGPMLLRKGELHRLVAHVDPSSLDPEVSAKLDLLATLFGGADGNGQG